MYTLNDSKDDLVKKLNNAQGVPQTIQMGIAFLNIKLQEEIRQEQNDFNAKQLMYSRWLAYGTWALVLVTLLLVKLD